MTAKRILPLTSALVLFAGAARAQTTSLDPAGSNVILSAVTWLQGTLLGNVATALAVIAVAATGLLMLTGRIDWRRGAVVILGCFIVFGAASIVAGIRSVAGGGAEAPMAEPLERDTVFGALTRPQMFAGVTYSWFVLEAVVTIELFLVTHSFWALLVAGVLHLVGYFGCLKEPRFFDLWLVRASRSPRVKNARFWRCNSYRA